MRYLKRFSIGSILIFINSFCISQYTKEANINEHAIGVKNNFPQNDFSTFKVTIDFTKVIYDYAITQNPTLEDTSFIKKYAKLIASEPSKTNYHNYYLLACSLWDLNKLEEAKKMFLKIINSKASFYVNSINYSSDIPGDTTSNNYGYGSFTTNYQNYAARYLAKIYIEQKQFESA